MYFIVFNCAEFNLISLYLIVSNCIFLFLIIIHGLLFLIVKYRVFYHFLNYIGKRKKNIALSILTISLIKIFIHYFFYRSCKYWHNYGSRFDTNYDWKYIDYSKENIRVNSICPGFIETPELIHYLSQTENPKLERQ